MLGLDKSLSPHDLCAFECPVCGTTLADVVTDGRPGCCDCYTKFASDVEDSIVKAQEHNAHVGKSPNS
jgi:protein arginine kinase activator